MTTTHVGGAIRYQLHAYAAGTALIFAGLAFGQESQRDTAALGPKVAIRNVGTVSGLDSNPSFQTYAPSTDGDSDLGDQLLLTRQDEYQALTLYGGVGGYFTDNAALTDGGEDDDWYLNARLGASFLPRLVNNLYGEATLLHQFYRYSDRSDLDFDSLETGAGLVNVFRGLGDLSAWARYEYTHLFDSGYGKLYNNHAIEIGLFKPIPIVRDHFAYLGYHSSFSLDASPGYSRRDEHALLAGYRYSATDRLDIEAFYRLTLWDYDEFGREDLNHYPGIGLTFRISNNVSLNGSATYVSNDSNTGGRDYESASIGGILGLSVKF